MLQVKNLNTLHKFDNNYCNSENFNALKPVAKYLNVKVTVS